MSLDAAAQQSRTLHQRLAVMETYLRTRLEMRDWHGVQDAASDIRELEAQLRLVDELISGDRQARLPLVLSGSP